MNYKQTLNRLYDWTYTTEVYVCPAYTKEGKPTVGIRREIAGGKYKDPVIDGTVFMIAGSINASSILDIKYTDNDRLKVHLRAVTSFPYTLIDLGEFHVMLKESFEHFGDEILLLHLERSN